MADTLGAYDTRTTAILDAVKKAFAEKGFDGASMQDLARAAGMSAGNFYRYFPSKNAIIEAMIARDLEEVKEAFGEVMASTDPATALLAAFEQKLDTLDCDDGPLWAEIDAAARRRPEIAQVAGTMETEICGFLLAVFSRIVGCTREEARQRYIGQAWFVMLLFKAIAQRLHGQACNMPPNAQDPVRRLFKTSIEQTIAAVAADGRRN